jgi:2-dehydro-3-deoxyphosphogluconate aldolase/(4S)-4-hydroxy-2-oxoglutarate aldolase
LAKDGRARVERILSGGVIGILRLSAPDDLLPAALAVREGGVTVIEFTLTTPGSLQALQPAREKLGRDVLLGVGTVLTAGTAKEAIQAGADFIVAPALNPEVVRVALEADLPVIPGAMTPTEIQHAWDLGARLIKVFPAGPLGPRYIKDLLAPLPHLRLVPTGGVTLENVAEFIRAGAAAVGVGGEMIPRDLLARRDFPEITRRARQFADAVRRAREERPTT